MRCAIGAMHSVLAACGSLNVLALVDVFFRVVKYPIQLLPRTNGKDFINAMLYFRLKDRPKATR